MRNVEHLFDVSDFDNMPTQEYKFVPVGKRPTVDLSFDTVTQVMPVITDAEAIEDLKSRKSK